MSGAIASLASPGHDGASLPSDGRFARACTRLGFDDSDLFVPRRGAVLSAFEAAIELTATQLRTIVRSQHSRLVIREQGRTVTFDADLKAALACVREEARLHGRVVALGQAWAGTYRLVALLTVRCPATTPVLASAVAGEVLCRVVDDVPDRRVLSRDDEDLLRHAWRAAHPIAPYFRRAARM